MAVTDDEKDVAGIATINPFAAPREHDHPLDRPDIGDKGHLIVLSEPTFSPSPVALV